MVVCKWNFNLLLIFTDNNLCVGVLIKNILLYVIVDYICFMVCKEYINKIVCCKYEYTNGYNKYNPADYIRPFLYFFIAVKYSIGIILVNVILIWEIIVTVDKAIIF